MDFANSYKDKIRANSYATLKFHNDYYLAFRDLPCLFKTFVKGTNALDFGCGTGRSTRFLEQQGFKTIGIDIAPEMIQLAKKTDPKGTYYLVEDGEYHMLELERFDLILSAFTFDNIPKDKKHELLTGLIKLLKKDGIFITIVSSPEMYTHEWASFSTKNYPENKHAKDGDVVPIITTEFKDQRPCFDILCTPTAYKQVFSQVGFIILHTEKPLATGKEPYQWTQETQIAPWTIYVLKKKEI